MPTKLMTISLLFWIFFFSGCSSSPKVECKPVLFPYSEYGYKAETRNLIGSYKTKDKVEKIEVFGISWELPDGWHYKMSGEWAAKFNSDDGSSFLLLFNKDKPFTDDTSGFHFIGCSDFVKFENPPTIRTGKEVTRARYLLTDEDISGEPTFWQYFILWTKTEILRDAVKLFHFKGKHLEAFQKNNDPRTLCVHSDIATQVEIFPDRISPDSITIASGFTDDKFFADILEMLDALNP